VNEKSDDETRCKGLQNDTYAHVRASIKTQEEDFHLQSHGLTGWGKFVLNSQDWPNQSKSRDAIIITRQQADAHYWADLLKRAYAIDRMERYLVSRSQQHFCCNTPRPFVSWKLNLAPRRPSKCRKRMTRRPPDTIENCSNR